MSRIKVSIIILLFLMTVVLCWAPMTSGIAFAAEGKAYSDVLEDLQKDSTFDASYYPDDLEDNSLKVITIAESEDNELFVYVYQPSAKARELTAVSIDISTTIYDALEFHNYHLKLLSRKGVFGKYLVEGLTVNPEGTRYYAVTDILRPWDKYLDKAAAGGNTISEVTFAVAKQWEFGELNGIPYVDVVDIETITVNAEDKFTGFVRYPGGYPGFSSDSCDSHFVAFHTDRPIDQLYEADVYYDSQTFHRYDSQYSGFKTEYGNIESHQVTVSSEQKSSFKGGGLFNKKFTWNRIQSVDEFIASAEFKENTYSGAVFSVSCGSKITDEAKTALQKNQWVLRFTETSYDLTHNNTPLKVTTSERYTIVENVKILRLKFVTNGKTYNLGVVDNKQSETPGKPINPGAGYDVEMSGNFKKGLDTFLKILLAVVIIVAIALVVALVFKVLQLFKNNKSVTKIEIPAQPDKPKEEVRKMKPVKKPKKKLKLKLPELPKLKKRGAAESTKKNKTAGKTAKE